MHRKSVIQLRLDCYSEIDYCGPYEVCETYTSEESKFSERAEVLSNLFRSQMSQSSARYYYLRLIKQATHDYVCAVDK